MGNASLILVWRMLYNYDSKSRANKKKRAINLTTEIKEFSHYFCDVFAKDTY